MAHDVKMPQMGESIAEGTVTTWLKKVGETIARDEPLFEVATDKVDAEIPSPATGTLTAILAEPGATVPIGTIVATIEEEGAATSPPPAAKAAVAAAASPAATPAAAPSAPPVSAPSPAPTTPAPSGQADGERPHKSSPLVRRMASEHGVDLQAISGSGMGGRITKEDMQAHLAGGAPAAAAAPPASAPAAHRAASPGHDESLLAAYRPKPLADDRIETLPGMRQKIAQHMVASKRISPHVATVWEMDFGHVAKLRGKHKAAWMERYAVNLTFTAFIIKATVDALKAFPTVNASIDGDKVYYHQSVHMGLAVALDWGLIVPVIHGADELNTLGLARRAADLAARARSKKLKPDDVQNGTFTITNPGSFGPMFNVPIINQPQVGILGVGTVEKRPVVIDDMIAVRTRAYLSLSFDHRLVDGAVADQFMGHIKHGVESFDEAEL